MNQNLVPIQITLQAANAADARQLVLDLAGTIAGMAPEQIPAQTVVSTVQAPVAPAAPVQTPPPPVYPPAAPQQNVMQFPPQQPAVPVAPGYPPAEPVYQQPAPVPPQQPATVPTTAPTYSRDQLAVAATQLMDAGKQAELVNLLGAFGVQALTQLPQEQFGAFATALRSLGAKI